MNKRLLNRVLLISLLVIWSVIIYKLVSGASKNDVAYDTSDYISDSQPLNAVSRDTFILQEVLRDPFLNKIKTVSIREKKPVKMKPNRVSNKKLPWPKISYFGFVQSEYSSSPLVLLSVDGRFFRVRKGDKSGGVSIGRVYNDSVSVFYGGRSRVYVKE